MGARPAPAPGRPRAGPAGRSAGAHRRALAHARTRRRAARGARRAPGRGRARAQVLRGCVAAGGLDGCTGRAGDTVDGLPWETHAAVLDALRAAAGLPP
jgi:hypothetical protein